VVYKDAEWQRRRPVAVQEETRDRGADAGGWRSERWRQDTDGEGLGFCKGVQANAQSIASRGGSHVSDMGSNPLSGSRQTTPSPSLSSDRARTRLHDCFRQRRSSNAHSRLHYT
jgi:hypothetical protein